jgi:hypothetical protein
LAYCPRSRYFDLRKPNDHSRRENHLSKIDMTYREEGRKGGREEDLHNTCPYSKQ